ncbi:GNAT family N-acetyltransferase [Roseibium aestuarii]|uniref:GNAT family N-acetyltransferase n=1 Tax=Roseibium aestuarii TaxID=2600299 RepID=A0ABW4K3A1_9HYPH|nr:GNAT family N-acetyltransferase [Roseibium aestuarii]
MSVPAPSTRLVYRPVTVDDAGFLYQLMTDAAYLRHIGDRNIHDEAAARAYIEDKFLPAYARADGMGVFLAERRADGAPVGIITLLQREGFQQPDIGYALLPAWRGHGYAREGAAALLAHAQETLGLNGLCAIVAPGNEASFKVLAALGFAKRGKILNPTTGMLVTVLDWKAERT